jgi:hypothetical protein
MRVRPLIAAICLIALIAGYSSAFEFEIHATITQQALIGVVNRFPADWADLTKAGFTAAATNEITDANIAKDTGDKGQPRNPNVPAQPDTTMHSESLAAFNYLSHEPATDHFDAESLNAASLQVYQNRNDIHKYLLQRNFVAARKILGGTLHAIQDFYAHTNYVELQINNIETRIGTKDGFSVGTPRVANLSQGGCDNGATLQPAFTGPSTGPLKDTKLLTSGYFFFTPSPLESLPLLGDPEVTNHHKCRHGWEFGVDQPGINKDSVDRPGHYAARNLALLHSINFITDLLLAPDIRKDPTIVRGFMGLLTISSLDPYEIAPGSDAFYLRVNGSGFTSWDAKPTVFFGNKPLATNFINKTLVTGRIEKADIAVVGRVPVTVKQFDTDAKGNVTNTILSSNEVWFQIADDCPLKIRPHKHDPDHPDVNAIKWNDTGLAVKAGDKLKFDVLPGSVVWRAGGLFTGSAGEAPPTGDVTATPANTLLWVDPQIPINVAPIGALIGMILDPKFTGPIIEKPNGAKYFPILDGKRPVPPMPASGELYLGINDGAFFNNGGCFQVKVTPIK